MPIGDFLKQTEGLKIHIINQLCDDLQVNIFWSSDMSENISINVKTNIRPYGETVHVQFISIYAHSYVKMEQKDSNRAKNCFQLLSTEYINTSVCIDRD